MKSMSIHSLHKLSQLTKIIWKKLSAQMRLLCWVTLLKIIHLLSRMRFKGITGITANVPFTLLLYIIDQRMPSFKHLFIFCQMILHMMLALFTKLWRQQLNLLRLDWFQTSKPFTTFQMAVLVSIKTRNIFITFVFMPVISL